MVIGFMQIADRPWLSSTMQIPATGCPRGAGRPDAGVYPSLHFGTQPVNSREHQSGVNLCKMAKSGSFRVSAVWAENCTASIKRTISGARYGNAFDRLVADTDRRYGGDHHGSAQP